ncbi:MAG: WG repeat-containing protein [Ruminococcaceae bacterium]|nr:WG repeat-containing protein [Oscillospiraceae bacterium]
MKKIAIILCILSLLLMSCDNEASDNKTDIESETENTDTLSHDNDEDKENGFDVDEEKEEIPEEKILDLSKGFTYRSDGKWGFLDEDGNVATDAVFTAIGVFGENGLIPAKMGDKWGYLDTKGEVVIEPNYYVAEPFGENGLAVISFDGITLGVIDKSGQVIIEPKWHKISFQENGLAIVGIDYNGYLNNFYYGVIDKFGTCIVEPTYAGIEHFGANGLAVCVTPDNKRGYINEKGEEIIPPMYYYCDNFKDLKIAQVAISKGDYYHFINEKGEAITDAIYGGSYTGTKNGFIIASVINYKCCLLDQDGNIILDAIYDRITELDNGILYLEKDGRFGFADKNGNLLTDIIYEDVGYYDSNPTFSGYLATIQFSNGLIPVQKNGKWGYIDESGKEVIDFKFSRANSFGENGLAKVSEEINYVTKFGCINTKGEYVIEPIYDSISAFSKSGLAAVEVMVGYESKCGFVNEKGKMIIEPIYNKASALPSCEILFYGEYISQYKLNYGFLDKNNNKLTEITFPYNSIYPDLNGNIIKISVDKTYTFYDKNGKQISDHTFTSSGSLTHNGKICKKDEYLLVKANDKYGVIGSNGKLVIEPIYDEISVTSIDE